MVWRSPAGDGFRAQLRGLAREIGSHAREIEEAAGALDRHASAVERMKRGIQDAQAWVTARINEAARTVREAGEGAVGAVELAIASAATTAPVGGSKDWLDLRMLFERRGWA
jgi:methyl-accepting chemotaxis protein